MDWLDGPEKDPEAPLDAGPPPLFDVMSFSQWVTRVFTEEHENAILDKLSGMPADDDNAKMRLLLNEGCEQNRASAINRPRWHGSRFRGNGGYELRPKYRPWLDTEMHVHLASKLD